MVIITLQTSETGMNLVKDMLLNIITEELITLLICIHVEISYVVLQSYWCRCGAEMLNTQLNKKEVPYATQEVKHNFNSYLVCRCTPLKEFFTGALRVVKISLSFFFVRNLSFSLSGNAPQNLENNFILNCKYL